MRLTPPDLALWHAWKRAGENVMARVGRDIAEATGLSGTDFGVLSRLDDLGHGALRQQELADSMAWDKSRLSHHLTRMEERGLVVRSVAGPKAVLVQLTEPGRELLVAARPVHAASIQKHFLGRIGPQKQKGFFEICSRLADDSPQKSRRI